MRGHGPYVSVCSIHVVINLYDKAEMHCWPDTGYYGYDVYIVVAASSCVPIQLMRSLKEAYFKGRAKCC